MKVYLIKNIEEYGKLMSYCIERDISVFRTYWDEREKGNRCYNISFEEKQCYHSSKQYYKSQGAEILIPEFRCTKFGHYDIEKEVKESEVKL